MIPHFQHLSFHSTKENMLDIHTDSLWICKCEDMPQLLKVVYFVNAQSVMMVKKSYSISANTKHLYILDVFIWNGIFL
jgi:hypothetical protein